SAIDLGVVHLLADVAAPDDARPFLHEVRDETGRLRVVADDDVSRTKERVESDRVRVAHLLEERVLRGAEGRTIAHVAVQRGVQGLGDAEELGRRVDDGPACVDAEAARVAQERSQELRHAATRRRRIDVPYGPGAEHLSRGFAESLHALNASG